MTDMVLVSWPTARLDELEAEALRARLAERDRELRVLRGRVAQAVEVSRQHCWRDWHSPVFRRVLHILDEPKEPPG